MSGKAGTREGGGGDDVHVIRHQVIARRRKAGSLGVIAQQLEIDAPIIVGEKHVLPVVPTLGHVVRLTRDNDSSNTRHAETLPHPPP